MAFNLTGVDAGQYFTTTVAVNASLFTTLVLPSLLLCMLCGVALIFAKEINSKIRLLLVNIFVAEISKWMSYTMFYLGWPLRLLYQDTITCTLSFTFFAIARSKAFMAAGFYAILVYTLIKYGEKKLKWCIVIPVEAVSWLLTLIIAALPFISQSILNGNGFCYADFYKSVVIQINAGVSVVIALLSLGVQITCGILTIIYIKKNTLEGNIAIKKATAKVLAYFIASSILSLINFIVPIFNILIRRAATKNNNTTAIIVVSYLLVVVFNIPSMATPFVTIALLKPVRVAIKAMTKKACMCCRTRSVNN